MDYSEFLATKGFSVEDAGVDLPEQRLHPEMFPFQRRLTTWALRKGRAAIFASTGLGKTIQQLEWARHAAARTLILAPLAVAQQTVQEGKKWGIDVTYVLRGEDAPARGIAITNYERLDRFDPSAFGAVVLDESSILKCFDGKTRTKLIETFRDTRLRLCCTATPAPNDITEIANHAEFLGVMTRVEMLAKFFVHDDQGWRLKGHARKPFYQWMASWAMSLRKPSELGFSDEGYELPSLDIRPVIIDWSEAPEGRLFAVGLNGIQERASVRRRTLSMRVSAAAELVNAEPDEQWLCWVGLNDEGRELKRLLPTAALVEGSQSTDEKAKALLGFSSGEVRTMITKAGIAGMGMNWQGCARMVFVGIGDSFEDYFQCIRRCWRFGQSRPVVVYIVLSDRESTIYDNVLRKEREAAIMGDELIASVIDFERSEIGSLSNGAERYDAQEGMILPHWLNRSGYESNGTMLRGPVGALSWG